MIEQKGVVRIGGRDWPLMGYADPEAQAEIDRLRAELDRLRKVLLAEWEKDRKTYAALMEKLK